jgi:archaellum component FlaC
MIYTFTETMQAIDAMKSHYTVDTSVLQPHLDTLQDIHDAVMNNLGSVVDKLAEAHKEIEKLKDENERLTKELEETEEELDSVATQAWKQGVALYED